MTLLCPHGIAAHPPDARRESHGSSRRPATRLTPRPDSVRSRLVTWSAALVFGLGCGSEAPDPGTSADPDSYRTIPGLFGSLPERERQTVESVGVSHLDFAGWTRSHGDNGATKYSTLDQIDRSNVAKVRAFGTYSYPLNFAGLLRAPGASCRSTRSKLIGDDVAQKSGLIFFFLRALCALQCI